jgi:hypothetical protein
MDKPHFWGGFKHDLTGMILIISYPVLPLPEGNKGNKDLTKQNEWSNWWKHHQPGLNKYL